jgi:hypothetical protein
MTIGVLVSSLVIAGAIESIPCQPDRMLHTTVPDSPIVLLGTLVERNEGDATRLSTFGVSEHARLAVKVRLKGIVKGDFPLQAGDEFFLGLHSVALTFGYDHVGETYYLGLEPESNSDFTLVALSIPPETLFFVRARIADTGSTSASGLTRVDVVAHPTLFATAVFEPGVLPPELTAGTPISLGLPSLDFMNRGSTTICMGLIRRDLPAVQPLRLIRIYSADHDSNNHSFVP